MLHPIVGGFYPEVALQKREAEGKVRTKDQLNLDPNPEGTQKNLDDRRYGGREEQRIVGGGAGAAQGVTGHLRALGDRTGSTVTNDGASVPEVLTPAKLESVLDGRCRRTKLVHSNIYCLLELNMLCDCVTRGCGDHSPLTTAAILEWRRRSAWGGAAAARRGLRGLGPDRPGIAGRCSPVGSRTGDPPAHAR